MTEPNIKMVRIDERLIHGQGQLWINSLGANLVIVANDEVSTNSIQQTLMKSLINKKIGMRFFNIEETCEKIHKASPKQSIFLVCKDPKDVLRLVEGGVPIKELNVGNIHFAEGKTKLSNYISVGEEDIAALKALKNDHGVVFNTKTTPLGGDAGVELDLNEYIAKN
ncbi:PTS sugar transporter subunit IIB [Vagococcus sp. PNs007]|uniref:PTS sugar transporter subunit IIB n=1 Tax=Vagococcus proximus TaxID=2991417 RepID=A0ABT5X267_9ENTE|nr:PTS system mannose/fructose/N-acetylgalactosamine-transporter subunit IIB [Vagococcus proximus]MDF0480082.1 PTS sugar transporter subunit IIB [Vagococcus proximus]